MRKAFTFLFALWVFIAPLALFSQSSENFSAHLYIDKTTKTALVELDVGADTHVYWKNPGETGAPVEMEWTLPEGVSVKQEKWPKPDRFVEQGIVGIGYSGNLLIPVDLEVSDENALENVEVDVSGVACSSDQCLPFSLHLSGEAIAPSVYDAQMKEALSKLPTKISLQEVKSQGGSVEIPLSSSATDVNFYPENPDHAVSFKFEDGSLVLTSDKLASLRGLVFFEEGGIKDAVLVDLTQSDTLNVADAEGVDSVLFEDEHTLISAIFFAFLGGILLNLMPCVLPVVSIKMLSLVKMAAK